jgi:uncharacterized membrane protein
MVGGRQCRAPGFSERLARHHERATTLSDFLLHLWDYLLFFLTIFIFIAWLMALFSIIGDVFRDRELGGFAKAIWLIALIFVPVLTALVYLIVRGRGMAERATAQVSAQKAATDDYIRTVAGASPTEEIARAKSLR